MPLPISNNPVIPQAQTTTVDPQVAPAQTATPQVVSTQAADTVAPPVAATAPRIPAHLENLSAEAAGLFPADLDVQGKIAERLQRFASRWPEHVRIIPDVRFAFSDTSSKSRRMVVISNQNEAGVVMSPADQAALVKDYIRSIGANTVSFPLSENAGHLYSRIGEKKLDFCFGGMTKRDYNPNGYRSLESVVELSPDEMRNLATYAGNGMKTTSATLGAFTAAAGPSKGSKSTLEDNRPTDANEKHNCTSWMAMAPIGPGGQQLRELVGAGGWQVHDNPGWWSKYLTSASRSPRTENVVLWENKKLSEATANITPGSTFPWRFGER